MQYVADMREKLNDTSISAEKREELMVEVKDYESFTQIHIRILADNKSDLEVKRSDLEVKQSELGGEACPDLKGPFSQVHTEALKLCSGVPCQYVSMIVRGVCNV